MTTVQRWNIILKHKDSSGWRGTSHSSEEAIFDEHSFENSYSIEVLFLHKGEGVNITALGLFDWNGLKSALTNNIVSSHSVSNMLNL